MIHTQGLKAFHKTVIKRTY